MNNSDTKNIASSENVVRLLNRIWIVDGVLQPSAFVLNASETYISVNRPAISSYSEDVADFLSKHPAFYAAGLRDSYCRASLSVGQIRKIQCETENKSLIVDVDVEPRSSHYLSHAGIFTRIGGVIVRPGKEIWLQNSNYGVSSESILIKLRFFLLKMATVETCQL